MLTCDAVWWSVVYADMQRSPEWIYRQAARPYVARLLKLNIFFSRQYRDTTAHLPTLGFGVDRVLSLNGGRSRGGRSEVRPSTGFSY